MAFRDGLSDLNDDHIRERLTEISPARRVTGNAPPFYLIHGDVDFMVPTQQSLALMAALQASHIPVELIVKKGGGHPWPTIHEEVSQLADWFDTQLAP